MRLPRLPRAPTSGRWREPTARLARKPLRRYRAGRSIRCHRYTFGEPPGRARVPTRATWPSLARHSTSREQGPQEGAPGTPRPLSALPRPRAASTHLGELLQHLAVAVTLQPMHPTVGEGPRPLRSRPRHGQHPLPMARSDDAHLAVRPQEHLHLRGAWWRQGRGQRRGPLPGGTGGGRGGAHLPAPLPSPSPTCCAPGSPWGTPPAPRA